MSGTQMVASWIAAIAAIMVCAASAAAKPFEGFVGDHHDGYMALRTLEKAGRPYAFKRIVIHGLHLHCDDGTRDLNFVLDFPKHFPYPLIASDGSFKTGVSSEGGRDLYLRGHIGRRTAGGEVRFRGSYGPNGVCRSSWQRWRLYAEE